MKRELLIGAGSNRDRKIALVDDGPTFEGLVTLDHNADHNPDVVWDLETLPLPFEDASFDSISAFDVLEHTGKQGDWRFFFAQWSDFWRIMKPGGRFYGIVPSLTSPWAWGDPSHTRVITPEQFTFLSQPNYDQQVGVTAMSDFRHVYQADFDVIHLGPIGENGEALGFILEAVKPSRCTRRAAA
jgi:SAM-dependent methyltransferase